MSNPRRRFSRELELEAIRRVQETGQTLAQVAEEIGVSAKTLCRWMKQFQIEIADPFPGMGPQFKPSRPDQSPSSRERANWEKYQTKKEAVEDLNWWIGSWYNPKRLHSSLGFMSPNKFGKEKNVA